MPVWPLLRYSATPGSASLSETFYRKNYQSLPLSSFYFPLLLPHFSFPARSIIFLLLWSCSFSFHSESFLSLVLSVLISVSVFIFLYACNSVHTYDTDEICGFSRTLSRSKAKSLYMLQVRSSFRMRIGSPERPSIGVFVM